MKINRFLNLIRNDFVINGGSGGRTMGRADGQAGVCGSRIWLMNMAQAHFSSCIP